MELRAEGQPLHTRSLALVFRWEESGRLAVRGDVIDLRKCGVVPVPGGLQSPGIIHHMHLSGWIGVGTRVLEALEVGQPVVAFEPSRASRGECCRDPVGNLEALVGQKLDAEFAGALSRCFGGPHGCAHLLALARLLASAAPDALDHARATGAAPPRSSGGPPPGLPGEQVLLRSLYVDGFESTDGALRMILQLSDVYPSPGAELRGPLDRFDHQVEVRVQAAVDLEKMTLRELRAAERRRAPASFASAGWEDRSDALAGLVGRSVMGGLGGEVLRRFGSEASQRRLLDVLLNVAPGFIQCVAALTERWVPPAQRGGPRVLAGELAPALSVGGAADSCYMWRRDGALLQARQRFLGDREGS